MFEGLWSVASFIVAIGVLVAFHEYGHFWVARRLGVKVLRFSVGFGKPLWTRVGRDGTEYVIAAIPLGGYVKMLDETEAAVAADELPRAFNRQKLWKRSAIVAAGPAFNFILAIAAYWLVYVSGVAGMKPLIAEPPAQTRASQAGLKNGETIVQLGDEPVTNWQDLRTQLLSAVLDHDVLALRVQDAGGSERPVTIDLRGVRVDPDVVFDDLGLHPYEPVIAPVLAEVVAGDPAEQAGLRAGDTLLTRDGEPIASWQDWTVWLRAHPGSVVKLRVQRGGDVVETSLIVARNDNGQGRFGARVEVPDGLFENLRTEIRYAPAEALLKSVSQTVHMSALTLQMLGRMITGEVSVKNVSGPIQIAQFAGYSASAGVVTFLIFIAVVSISLGVLNLLPIPVLDGGHLLFYAVEAVKGSPLSERAMAIGQRFGVTVLLALMGLAFYNDLHRLLS